MRLVEVHDLLNGQRFQDSVALGAAWTDVQTAIAATDWPHGAGSFRINPTRRGNGVDPIKVPCIQALRERGWAVEKLPKLANAILGTGDLDALLGTPEGYVAFEWETGNISSSHRAINKLLLAMQHEEMLAGILVVPSKALYRYLTDRIGNVDELKPYFPLWRRAGGEGALRIVVVEHDEEDASIPCIGKRTDGRARR